MRSHQMALRSCLAILSGSLIFPLAVLAQSSPAAAGGRRKEDVLLLLKRQLQAQRRQIESLTRELAAQQQLLNRLTMDEGKVPDHGRADTSVAQKSLGRLNRPTASSPVPDRASQAAQSAAAEASRANGGLNGEMVIPQAEESKGSPAARKIGSATLTPFGFVDATAFFRTRNLGSGIGSSFGSLPFSNTVQGHMSETRFSAQNSRFGLQYDSRFHGSAVRGYMETDFLGVQPANAFVTSNSNSLRLRLYWVDVKRGKLEFLTGQSWSLLTPGREGISAMPSNLFYTQNMDTNYQAGLTWARQLQFRFV